MAAPTKNKNAEKWTLKQATELFNEAYELSLQDKYDFIGEIARDLGVYRTIFNYLSTRFSKLKPLYDNILSNLEANCFEHAKTGKIKEATAIINLKSNYNWTDRQRGEYVGEVKINVRYEDRP